MGIAPVSMDHVILLGLCPDRSHGFRHCIGPRSELAGGSPHDASHGFIWIAEGRLAAYRGAQAPLVRYGREKTLELCTPLNTTK